jgi:twitching motility protein PilT
MAESRSTIKSILKMGIEKDASDVHLKVGVSPAFRIRRELIVETSLPVLTQEDLLEYLKAISSEEQQQQLFRTLELDFAYNAEDIGRFRVNGYFHLGSISLAFRWVRGKIPNIEGLGLPPICKDLVMKREGMVIVTGPTGSGKSTTLAAMLHYMNEREKRNVITIEDPVEFLHRDNKCTFSQREVGVDTQSFAAALKHVLRQDPDVILVGEMRDLETMGTALTAAETGHLVLTTLHTPSSYEAIDRFVDAFPPHQHTQIRLQLSTTLQGIIYQTLIPRADMTGLVPAVEVLIATPAIRNLIREGKTHQMPNFMHSGQAIGMQTVDQSLIELYNKGAITSEQALSRMHTPENFTQSQNNKASVKAR